MSLIVDNVSYTYDAGTPFENTALDRISLEINKGEFVGISGRTGSGKSTLAKIIAGLLSPTSGKVTSDLGRAGIVFQNPDHQLFEETVIKDIMFGPRNLGKTEEEALLLARQAMSVVDLDAGFEERNPLMLSGGEKRRAAIAGILAMEPEVLLLDEPAAGLDAGHRNSLFSMLSCCGKTVICISHDDISRYCTRTIYIENGRLSEDSAGLSLEDRLRAKGLIV